MPDEKTTPAEIDYDKLGAAMAKHVGASLKEHLTPLNERLEKLTAPPAADAETGKKKDASAPAGVTLDQVAKLLDDKLTAQQNGQQQRQQREGYLDTKLKDLPAAYRNQLGNDSAKWAAEEQAIRDQFKADRQALGVTIDDKGGTTTTAGAKPGGAVDYSKMTPMQKIELGVKNSKVTTGAKADAESK